MTAPPDTPPGAAGPVAGAAPGAASQETTPVAWGQRVAWLVWAGGLVVYVVAVFQRFSMSVAGVDAVERLGLTAAALSVIAVAQLAVYAMLQVPVGILVDRFGYRRLLIAGALLMAGGQTALAFAHGMVPALGARLLVGLGDGLVFICVVRLVAACFSSRHNPLLIQLTGLIGQLGAIASAVPVVHLLQAAGWTKTFLVAAGIGVLSAIVGLALLRDPPTHTASSPPALRELGRMLRRTWAEPGTRLGLWTHFATQFPAIAFALLWGYPFLVVAQRLDPSTAGVLLTLLTLSFMCFGPVLGHLVGRYPLRRSRMALLVVGSSAAVWACVLLWPGPAPLWLLVTLVVVLGVNQPGSMIGFDFARSFNPASRLGTASGMVNVGGYLASLTSILLIGLVLALYPHAGGTYDPAAFRWAFLIQYPLWALGAVQIVRYRRKARRAYGGRPATVAH
jgi:MFS family permease